MNLKIKALCLLFLLTLGLTLVFVQGTVDEKLSVMEHNKATLRELSESEEWNLSLYRESLELGLTYKQFAKLKKILVSLRRCESSNDDTAINEVDLDGTSSYGRFQFKPDTLYDWGMKYKLLPANLERSEAINFVMDGDLQQKILIRAIIESGLSDEWWLSQFPWCSARYEFWITWSI